MSRLTLKGFVRGTKGLLRAFLFKNTKCTGLIGELSVTEDPLVLYQGLLEKHLEFIVKGSFTLSTIWISYPGVSWLFMFLYFFVKCKSLYKSPSSFFPSNILMFFCSFGGRFCYYSFNHPSTSLFFFFFFFFGLFTCTNK